MPLVRKQAPADPRTLREYLRDAWTARLAAYEAEGDDIMPIYYRQRLAELESGQPVALTAQDVPARYRPGTSPWDAFTLEADDTLRPATVYDPEAA